MANSGSFGGNHLYNSSYPQNPPNVNSGFYNTNQGGYQQPSAPSQPNQWQPPMLQWQSATQGLPQNQHSFASNGQLQYQQSQSQHAQQQAQGFPSFPTPGQVMNVQGQWSQGNPLPPLQLLQNQYSYASSGQPQYQQSQYQIPLQQVQGPPSLPTQLQEMQIPGQWSQGNFLPQNLLPQNPLPQSSLPQNPSGSHGNAHSQTFQHTYPQATGVPPDQGTTSLNPHSGLQQSFPSTNYLPSPAPTYTAAGSSVIQYQPAPAPAIVPGSETRLDRHFQQELENRIVERIADRVVDRLVEAFRTLHPFAPQQQLTSQQQQAVPEQQSVSNLDQLAPASGSINNGNTHVASRLPHPPSLPVDSLTGNSLPSSGRPQVNLDQANAVIRSHLLQQQTPC